MHPSETHVDFLAHERELDRAELAGAAVLRGAKARFARAAAGIAANAVKSGKSLNAVAFPAPELPELAEELARVYAEARRIAKEEDERVYAQTRFSGAEKKKKPPIIVPDGAAPEGADAPGLIASITLDDVMADFAQAAPESAIDMQRAASLGRQALGPRPRARRSLRRRRAVKVPDHAHPHRAPVVAAIAAVLLFAAGCPAQTTTRNADQVLTGAYNATQFALNGFAGGNPRACASPTSADQVLSCVYDSAHAALDMYLVNASASAATALMFGSTSDPLSSTAPTSGQVLEWNGTNIVGLTVSGTGTVTSVGLSLPSIFAVTGSPVTGSGTLTGTYTTGLTSNENEVLGVNGSGAVGLYSITGAMLPDPAGDVTGTYGATTVMGLHFGTNAYTLSSTVLTSGQCIGYNGTDILGVTCGAGGGGTMNSILAPTATGGFNIPYLQTWTCTVAPCWTITDSGTGNNADTMMIIGTNATGPSVTNPIQFQVQGVPQESVLEFVGNNGGIYFGSNSTVPFPLTSTSGWDTAVDVAKFVFEAGTAGFTPVRIGNTSTSQTAPVLDLRTSTTGASTVPMIDLETGCGADLHTSCVVQNFKVDALGDQTVNNLTDATLTAGDCVQASTAGLLTTTSAACGSGGDVTLETNGTANTSQTLLNLENSAATNGVTLSVTNASDGVQLALSGTLNDAGIASAYSGVGSCPANEFAITLARNAAPTCAAALAALTAPAHEFFDAVTAAGGFSAAQPAFSDLSGTVSAGQIPNPAGDVTGTYSGTTVTGLHFGTNGYTLSSTALTSGQCIGYNGTNILGVTCGSGAGTTLETNGTNNSSQTALNLVAGSNVTLTNTSGGNVTIAATGGGSGNLPSSWSTVASNTSLLGVGTASTDETTLNLTPASLSGNGTYNILQVSSYGTAASTSCTAGVYFAVEWNGNICFAANELNIGQNNQPTASAFTLFGGMGAGPYIEQESPALTPPPNFTPTLATTGGSLPSGQTFEFEWVYKSGTGTVYETTTNPAGFESPGATANSTSEVSVPLPSPWEPGVVALELYGKEVSNGSPADCGSYTYATNAWSGTGCGTVAVSGSNLVVSTWSYGNTNGPVTVNDSGGINSTYFSAAEQAPGAACFSISVPGQDCPLANALYMSGGEGLNLEIPAGANGIVAGNVVAYSSTAGIVTGDKADQVTIAPASSTNFIGVAAMAGQSIYVQTSGLATVTLDGSYTTVAGDFACMSTTGAGEVTQSSTACPAGTQVGIIAQAGTSLTSALVQLTSAQGVSGGGSSTAFQANGTALTSSGTVNFENGGPITVTNPSAGNVMFSCTTCIVTNPSATQTITAGSASVIPLVIRNASGQTADVLDVYGTGGLGFEIAPGGTLIVPSGFVPQFNGGIDSAATVDITNGTLELSGTAANFDMYASAGEHINDATSDLTADGCAASSNCTDGAGMLAVSAATSGSYTFTMAYVHAPACVASPTSNPSAVTWWVTTSTTAVTVNLSASSTLDFNYVCRGNPN